LSRSNNSNGWKMLNEFFYLSFLTSFYHDFFN
jgi:hypothetical protein